MLTVRECLAKAAEMDAHAECCATLELRAGYLDAAMRWRDLARRALIHENLSKSDRDAN